MNGEKERIRELKAGKEWWGKRPLANTSVSRTKGMKLWKRILHKIERKFTIPDIYLYDDEQFEESTPKKVKKHGKDF